MAVSLDFSKVNDETLLALAFKARALAEADGSTEFADIPTLVTCLEDDVLSTSVLTRDSAMRAMYVRLIVAVSRLEGRSASKDGLDLSVCPYDITLENIDDWTVMQRRAWMDGHRSAEPTFSIEAAEPQDDLRLAPLISLPIRAEKAFCQSVKQWEPEYPGITDHIALELSKIAIAAAKASTKAGNGIRRAEVPSYSEFPAIELTYRLNCRQVIGVDVSLGLRL